MNIILPVPDSAGKPPASFKGRTLTKQWGYRNAEAQLLGYVQRYDTPGGGKDVVPMTYWEDGGQAAWKFKQFPTPRPLYGLQHLAANPDSAVIVCEGEKATDAARKQLPGMVAITSSGGAQSAAQTDWGMVTGRRVIIWPDADKPGAGYADEVARLVLKAGATSVAILDLDELERLRGKGEIPDGYDAADALEEGDWFRADFLEQESLCVPYEPHLEDEEGTDAAPEMPADAIVIDPGDPFAAVQLLLDAWMMHDDGRILQRWSESWYRWNGTVYEVVADELMRARMYRMLARCWMYDRRGEAAEVKPTKRMVDTMLDALRGRCIAPAQKMPAWLTRDDAHPAPTQVVAFANGLLDAAQLSGDAPERLLPHTPLWFSANVLPYDFHPEAQCPVWKQFLEVVSGGDKQWVRALRRVFGYLLTADTQDQKIVWLVGPPRSGKGTILRVMRDLVGEHNVCAPSMASLGTSFGLHALVGKTVALCGEIHLGGHADRAAIVEALKKISGEDAVDINRKYKDPLTNVRLPVRFVLAANEMPSLPDVSGALAARCLIFPFMTSFEGKEDLALSAKLAAETAGICQWALGGLCSYRSDGRLLQPDSGKDAINEFRLLGAPVQAWWRECVEVGDACVIPCDSVYKSWQAYCTDSGHEAGSKATFGSKLRAAFPQVGRERDSGSDGKRTWIYTGFTLTKEARKRAFR